MSERALAIDLFCGLFQAKLVFRADTAVKQFVTSWTKNPDHIALGIGDETPRFRSRFRVILRGYSSHET